MSSGVICGRSCQESLYHQFFPFPIFFAQRMGLYLEGNIHLIGKISNLKAIQRIKKLKALQT